MAAPRTGSSLIEAYLARTGMLPSGSEKARYDELTGLAETGFVRQAGGVRPGWTDLSVTVDAIGAAGLRDLVDRVERLLEDDGVTYTPLVPTDRHLQEPTANTPRAVGCHGSVPFGSRRARRWRRTHPTCAEPATRRVRIRLSGGEAL